MSAFSIAPDRDARAGSSLRLLTEIVTRVPPHRREKHSEGFHAAAHANLHIHDAPNCFVLCWPTVALSRTLM